MAVSGRKLKPGLSASVALASDEDVQIYCQPCDREGPRIPAFGFCQDCNEHLCLTCYHHHKKATPSRHHVLLDKDSMPKTKQRLITDVHAKKSEELTRRCPKHKKKVIKYYCKDHDELLCSVCVTLKHIGKSCNVDYIPDISSDILDSEEIQEIVTHGETIMERCKNVKQDCKEATETSNGSLDKAQKDIMIYRKEINETIDKLETDIKRKAKVLRDQNFQNFETTEALCEDVVNSIAALLSRIKGANMSRHADKLFVELKTATSDLKEQEACIHDIAKSVDMKIYQFKPNENITTLLRNEKCLGTLEERKFRAKTQEQLDICGNKSLGQAVEKVNVTTMVPPEEQPYVFVSEIPINTPNDKGVCLITGITILNSETLVVADYWNMSIKMIDIKNKTVSSETSLSFKPWDITSVSSNELAVTLPVDCTILFLLVLSNKITKTRQLKVNGCCRGITYYKDVLVVSYEYPEKVEILNMKGAVLKQIATDENGKNIFTCPNYVQATNHSIFVSDRGQRQVVVLSWQGQVCCFNRNLGKCQGMALSLDGTAFVCCQNENNIVQIAHVNSVRNSVIHDVVQPFVPCWSDEEQLLYISTYTYTEKDNTILVYGRR